MTDSRPQTPSTPVSIGIAVPRLGDRILIARRGPTESLAGYWEFPGGKVHPKETSAEAARRECREELGIEVEVGPLLCRTEHEYPHGRVILHFHEAVLRGPLPDPRCRRDWRLIRPDELDRYPFPEANAEILALLAPRR